MVLSNDIRGVLVSVHAVKGGNAPPHTRRGNTKKPEYKNVVDAFASPYLAGPLLRVSFWSRVKGSEGASYLTEPVSVRKD